MTIPANVLTALNSLATALETSAVDPDRQLDKIVPLYYQTQVLRGEVGGGTGGVAAASPTWVPIASLGSTKQAISTVASNLAAWNLINPNASAVYVKFYNASLASTTVGTTTPFHTLMVPASGSVVFQSPTNSFKQFSTAITIACVTGLADNDTTAPSTAIRADIGYVAI